MTTLAEYLTDNPHVYTRLLFKLMDDCHKKAILKSFGVNNEKLLEQCNSLPRKLQQAKYFLDSLAPGITVSEFVKALYKIDWDAIAKNISLDEEKRPDGFIIVHERYVYGQRLDEYLEENPGLVESLIDQLSGERNDYATWHDIALCLCEFKSLYCYVTGTWIDDIIYTTVSDQEAAKVFLQRLSKICATKEFFKIAAKHGLKL